LYNAQNQTSTVSVGTAPTYDNNGNTISDNGQTFVYDAWNRLVAAKSGSTTVAAYTYDALGRRISEAYSGTSTTNYLYYSPQWQVIEERQNGTGTNNVSQQYVWGAAYIDQMISRDTYTSGSISSTLFVLQDANWNVTALTDSSGNVVERYLYDPYGDVTVLNASWVPVSGNVSAFGWRYYHQGGRLDPVTGWYDFRNRDYIPSEGRRAERDPMGFGGGYDNIYTYEYNDPTNLLDPLAKDPIGAEGDTFQEEMQNLINKRIKEMNGVGRFDAEDFWNYNLKGSKDQYMQFERGCVGLCIIRTGVDKEYTKNLHPNAKDGAHCFKTFKEALNYMKKVDQCKKSDTSYAITASQSTLPLKKTYQNPQGEINGKNFDPGAENLATYHQPIQGEPFWEYMNHAPRGGVPAKVIHSTTLSEEGWTTTIYCVVPIGPNAIPPAKCK
jgi:RHS repeat-associated protein